MDGLVCSIMDSIRTDGGCMEMLENKMVVDVKEIVNRHYYRGERKT